MCIYLQGRYALDHVFAINMSDKQMSLITTTMTLILYIVNLKFVNIITSLYQYHNMMKIG